MCACVYLWVFIIYVLSGVCAWEKKLTQYICPSFHGARAYVVCMYSFSDPSE